MYLVSLFTVTVSFLVTLTTLETESLGTTVEPGATEEVVLETMVVTGPLATAKVVLETAEPLGAEGFDPLVEEGAAPEVLEACELPPDLGGAILSLL